MPEPSGIKTQSVGFTVSGMARSLDFYTQVLPFQKTGDQTLSGPAVEQLTGLAGVSVRVMQLQLGDETIELSEYSSPGQSIPADTCSNDRWFQHVAIVVSDMAQAYDRLQHHHVKSVSPEPQTLPAWNEDMGGIQAFYFRDPDGHFLELIQFPPDKGAAKWHQASDDLFLGIDHTAIVVADTDTSLKFYQEVAGLKLEQTMQNHGEEHARLSQVPDIQIKVTRLNSEQGIGLELLEYLAPRTGRPMPEDIRPNDPMHGEITIAVPDVLTVAKHSLVSSLPAGIDAVPAESDQFSQGLLVRDPDGHALRLVEAA